MVSSSLSWLLALSTIAPSALAVLSPSAVNSDLTIIGHDDLAGGASPRQDAVIVLSSPKPGSEAIAACQALGTTLWTPKSNDYLPYLVHSGCSKRYWVNNGTGGLDCYDITPVKGGKQGSWKRWPGGVGCGDKLPILCENMAPIGTQANQTTTPDVQVQVKTPNATITGYTDRFSFKFLGVHYAQQPTRWTYSTPYDPQGNVSALALGSQCLQQYGGGSEDCLFANIITPTLPVDPTNKKSLKPVMVYIHGGAYTGGSGGDQGPGLTARGDVVLVSINYRLSSLGFLALNDGVTNGNYGIGDQITALQWIQRNIASFGGDPSRVTIFGQSAGAGSVRALLGSPKASGLFAGAIMQSNLAGTSLYASTYSIYYNISQEVKIAADPLIAAVGCNTTSDVLSCLRGVNATDLVSFAQAPRYVVVDGSIITNDQLEVNGDGPVNKVPVINGYMRDDGAAFIGYPLANQTVQTFLQANQGFNVTDETLALFPNPNSSNSTLNVFNVSAQISEAEQFRCLDSATSWSAATHNTFESVYQYQFNRSYQTTGYDPNAPVCDAPITPGYPHGNPNEEYFKCHSGEIYYTFGLMAYGGVVMRDDADLSFAQYIVDLWTSFARTADPNPDPSFLAARGFTNTSASLAMSPNRWTPVKGGKQNTEGTVRNLQAPFAFNSGFYGPYGSKAQCDALGLPIDFWENRQ